jgi:CMP-N-acetylneuraminic acid synthetase|tara:strand:+ start:29767 stop:30393 length:627 start_codon:yes stop_codon:yes gene_type:complete
MIKVNDFKKLEIAVVIPARGGSKRLKDKNIYPVLGKPMINWVLEEVLASKHINSVYVTSESEKILNTTLKDKKIICIKRPKQLSSDDVEKMDAIAQAVEHIISDCNLKNPDIVISLQANSPSLKIADLDNAINFFYENLYLKKPVCELISIGEDNLQNACFRIMTQKTVFQKTLSTNVGVYFTNCHDVHTIEDVKIAEAQILSKHVKM